MNLGMRIRVVAIFSAVVLIVALPAAAADKEPIRIGFMTPLVGVYAKIGKDMDNGFRLAFEEMGNKVAGRPIVIVTEDTEAKPELGPTKARKLIEKDKVQVMAGIIHSGVAASIRDIVVSNQIPTVITYAGLIDLTAGKLKSPYIFRVSFMNGQQELAAGWYAYHKMGMKRMIVLAPDFSGGHEKADAFIKAFKSAGGQVVEEIYPPLNSTDFSPYLTKINAKAGVTDGVWMFFPGSGSLPLLKQYQEYGLKDRVPLFINGDTIDEAILPSLREDGMGVKSYHQYSDTVKTPENEKFVKAYVARYKDYPGSVPEHGYVGGRIIAMALEAVKGNIENKEAFLAAMRQAKFKAPRGFYRFDENQNAIIPVYIREMRKVEGRGYANVVIDTIATDVDQNWSPAKLTAGKKR
jgi:branched-chain amino acid transport system substrate-binding protein